jgi:hypothetical protein
MTPTLHGSTNGCAITFSASAQSGAPGGANSILPTSANTRNGEERRIEVAFVLDELGLFRNGVGG